MGSQKKLQQFQSVLARVAEVASTTSADPVFNSWKNEFERAISRAFGEESLEMQQFRRLDFFYRPLITYADSDYSLEDKKVFENDLAIARELLLSCIDELQDSDEQPLNASKGSSLKKVFVSHSSKDADFVEVVIDLLELFGLNASNIFCTSLDGYGVPLGEDFLERIRNELNDDTLVLFILSHNFYASPVCLCEMGAAWVQTKAHIPILIPPMEFSEVKGVIPFTQGFKINEPAKLNLFKTTTEEHFSLGPTLNNSTWERKRDREVMRLNQLIARSQNG